MKGGIDVAGLGIGSLTEILITGDFGPYLYQSPEPGNVLSRSVFEGAAATKRFLWELDAIYQAVAQQPQQVAVALTAEDIDRFRSEGKLSLLIRLDSGVAIEDLATLRLYHRLGLRKLELVHSFPFQWADSSVGSMNDDDPGLEDFGLEVVQECNRLGILADISHGSDQTMWDALETSTKPMIASHSGARAVVDAHRNLTDEMLLALAKAGGMIGVGAYYDPELLEPIRATGAWTATSQIHNHLAGMYPDPFDLAAALRSPVAQKQARNALGLGPPSPLASPVPRSGVLTEGSNVQGTLDHIDHIVKLDQHRPRGNWHRHQHGQRGLHLALSAVGPGPSRPRLQGRADRQDLGRKLSARPSGQCAGRRRRQLTAAANRHAPEEGQYDRGLPALEFN